MSWSLSVWGPVPAVKQAAEAMVVQKFDIPAEQQSYDAAKQMILATLDCMDDSRTAFVQASGSAYQTTGSRSGEVKVSVTEYPITMWAGTVGQRVG